MRRGTCDLDPSRLTRKTDGSDERTGLNNVILGGESARRAAGRGMERGPASESVGSAAGVASAIVPPFTAFGLVLLGVGIVDLGLVWWPLQIGTGEWEFGVASRTFTSLALGTTGFVLLVVAAAAQGWVLGLRVLAVLALVGLLFLLGALLLFGTNVPVALSVVPDQTRPALVRSIGRTVAFAALYIPLFGWMSWFTWRRAGAAKGAP